MIPAALEQLREAKAFTKLDLHNTYNLVRIREEDKWKTAFSTTSSHYHYQVMPYGLARSPSVFQCLISDMLQECLGKYVTAYIDDILIYSCDLQSPVTHVKQVVQLLRENHLYVKGEKCEFHQPSYDT